MSDIARAHDVNPASVYRHAKRDGWQRAPGDAQQLARLRALASQLFDHLERAMGSGQPAAGEAPGNDETPAKLGGRESPVALLLKLCQITEKIISIERQLAGADAPTPAQLNEQDREILNRFKRRFRVG